MNQDLRSALESMLDPEQNGWAFTERQRDCARVLLGLAPVELPKDVTVFDLLGMPPMFFTLPDPAPLPEGD
jgi:hypothetical protein